MVLDPDPQVKQLKHILKHSVEQFDKWAAVGEWYYKGEANRYLRGCFETCELCDQHNLLSTYKIHNRLNGNSMEIGSTCIFYFVEYIQIFENDDPNGQRLTSGEAKAKLIRDMRQRVKDGREDYVLSVLEQLQLKESSLKFAANYINRSVKHFSPAEIVAIFKHAVRLNVSLYKDRRKYFNANFKVKNKTELYKNQIREMSDKNIRWLYPALTSNQIELVKRERRFGTSN